MEETINSIIYYFEELNTHMSINPFDSDLIEKYLHTVDDQSELDNIESHIIGLVNLFESIDNFEISNDNNLTLI